MEEEHMTINVLDLKEEKSGSGRLMWLLINENIGRLKSERTVNTCGIC